MSEQCKNPFKPKCKGTNIKVYITQEALPICAECWAELAEADIEW